jgi:predicted dienelactone hydrolase
MRGIKGLLFGLAVAAAGIAGAAQAGTVGQRHLVAPSQTAALRDAAGRAEVRVTVWYPAAASAKQTRLDLGAPGRPLFLIGAVAPEAPFADDRRRPVILLSHGFGGSARMMGWFGLAMAQAGYVVVAVDHPGNNGLDRMTAAGATLHWARADDLRAALDAVARDPALAAHIDRARLGVSGFSAGGYTALVAAGARPDTARLLAFCRANPADGICRPQREFALSLDQAVETLRSPALAAEVARAGHSHAIPGVRAVFAIAPALIQALTPESLAHLPVPVSAVLGDVDAVAPPPTNGLALKAALPAADVQVLRGVRHYDFLSACTDAGRAEVPLCDATVPQARTHAATIAAALALFRRTLGEP